MDGIVDSADEARKAVRYQHKYGADSDQDHAHRRRAVDRRFRRRAAVHGRGDAGDRRAAHCSGMKVAAHAHGKQGIDAAIRAGVRLDRARHLRETRAFKLFKEHGTYLVPTIIAGKTVAENGDHSGPFPPDVQAKAAKIGPLIQDMFKRAYAAGVKSRVRHRLRRVESRRERARVSATWWKRECPRPRPSSPRREMPPI
jgi:imidazolonepropionase-like amidohydrolase